MANFVVNGKNYTSTSSKKLIDFLREDLRLTSVKNGCSEGACGTCTILIDGKAKKCCTLTTDKIDGCTITTVEGLTQREKDVYTYAFGKVGAVQCGYCIPGMIICAKGLLDVNPNPSEEEIRFAIRNNICRCTGYVKIVKAIQLAAEVFRNKDYVLDNNNNWKVGARVPRIDVLEKVTGAAIYPDDLHFGNQLDVVAVRSDYPRAKVVSIDTYQALKLDGVVAVFTAKDIPGNKVVGHLVKDWDAMIAVGEITRFRGDALALVVAKNLDIANQAKSLVKVEYEVLQPVLSPYEAMKENAPLVHESGNLLGSTELHRGNVEKAFKESSYIVEEHYSTQWTEHAFLETECAVALPQENGVIKIYTSDQGVYDTLHETAPMLGLPQEKVVVENCYVGGGFGGKEDVSVQHLAALCALLTNKPCKMKLTRNESIQFHPKRHPMDIDVKLGCNNDGKILGCEVKIIADTGAYASLGLAVLQRACTHASGPYNFQNFKVDGKAYYTNNPPAGAFRGFGVTQSCFAMESTLNKMADVVGISHWDIRYINAIRPGEELPNGQIVDKATALVETLESVKGQFLNNKYVGIACAMKNAGVGVGFADTGRVRLEVKDSKVLVHCGGSCIGQGFGTVLTQIICETANLSSAQIQIEKPNSQSTPDSGTTSGSRHTTISGEAARRAALKLKEALAKSELSALNGCEFYAEYVAQTDPFDSKLPNPKSHIAYGYATELCILDEESHRVKKMVASFDVGKAINPTSLEGQIEGGTVMGLGFALREKLTMVDGKPMENFGRLGLFKANEVPEIESIIVEKPGLDVSYGAKGIGEITCIPTAPAVADAYYSLDKELRTVLPLVKTPYSK